MAIKLILLEDIQDLGRIGDTVRVRDGYARNYLLPLQKAAPVTPATMRRLEARKKQLLQEKAETLSKAKALGEKLSKESVTLAVQASEDDKLYGSIGDVQIAAALAESGINIDRHAIKLEEPIKELGVYTVDVQLHAEVKTSLKVWVVRA